MKLSAVTQENAAEVVIVTHGLWLMGPALAPQCHFLARAGFAAAPFSYSSVRADLAQNARALARFAATFPARTIHYVGHSMGGLVILKMLENDPGTRAGRIVLLGTPYRSSHAAVVLARSPLGRLALGRSIMQWLRDGAPEFRGERDLGVIAGARSFGAGRIAPGLPRPNDGTVAVEETRVPGMRDRVILQVSHTEMLFSTAVAGQVSAFLKRGCFFHGAD